MNPGSLIDTSRVNVSHNDFKTVLSRQDAKHAKKELLSFRPKGEILLRSLAFARDDGPQPVTLAAFAPLRES